MIQGIGSSSAGADMALAAQKQRQTQLSSPVETASPFEIAQQIQEVQTQNFKRTLDAQTQILDLLA